MNKETEKLILEDLLGNLKSQSIKRRRRLKSSLQGIRMCRLLFLVTAIVCVVRDRELTDVSGAFLFLGSAIGFFASSSVSKLILIAIDDEKNGHSGLEIWHKSINKEDRTDA